jgi:hypothetical protein
VSIAILNTPGLQVVDGEIIFQAILWYAEKNVDFIDAYNAAWLFNQGLTSICTDDRKHFLRFDHLNVYMPGDIDEG